VPHLRDGFIVAKVGEAPQNWVPHVSPLSMSSINYHIYNRLPPSNPKNPTKKLSSPQASGKQDNYIKTKAIKVENKRVFSFGPFGKIELTEKSSRPGSKSRAFRI
jgi:hypothetical protein